jgi:hypothetical protein
VRVEWGFEGGRWRDEGWRTRDLQASFVPFVIFVVNLFPDLDTNI